MSQMVPEVLETIEDEREMWYDDGSGILRELVECYTLTDGSVVYVKTSKYRVYNDSEVEGEDDE